MSLPKGWKNEPGEQIDAKADASYGKTQYLMLGLTEANIARLKAGKSIGIDLEALGYPGAPHKVIMVFGETHEAAMKRITDVAVVQVDLDITRMPKS